MDEPSSMEQGSGRWRHAFLWGLLGLVAVNVVMAVWQRSFNQSAFLNLFLVLGLLFNHVAFKYTKTGWPSRVMKGLVWLWISSALVMTIWVFVGWMTPAPRG